MDAFVELGWFRLNVLNDTGKANEAFDRALGLLQKLNGEVFRGVLACRDELRSRSRDRERFKDELRTVIAGASRREWGTGPLMLPRLYFLLVRNGAATTARDPAAGNSAGSGLVFQLDASNRVCAVASQSDRIPGATMRMATFSSEGTVARSFTYDAENRQVTECINTCAQGSPTATYTYDGEGQRVSKTVNGADDHVRVRCLRQSGGGVWRRLDQRVRDADLLCDDGPSGFHALADEQYGRCRRTLRLRAVRAGDRGELRRTTGGDGLYRHARADNENPKFTGQMRDPETTDETDQPLDYLQRSLLLRGAQGRFQSPDPANAGADLSNPQSWNGYAYVGNNPAQLYRSERDVHMCLVLYGRIWKPGIDSDWCGDRSSGVFLPEFWSVAGRLRAFRPHWLRRPAQSRDRRMTRSGTSRYPADPARDRSTPERFSAAATPIRSSSASRMEGEHITWTHSLGFGF